MGKGVPLSTYFNKSYKPLTAIYYTLTVAVVGLCTNPNPYSLFETVLLCPLEQPSDGSDRGFYEKKGLR